MEILKPWVSGGSDHAVEARLVDTRRATRWLCRTLEEALDLRVELLGLRWRREVTTLEMLGAAASRPPDESGEIRRSPSSPTTG